MSVFFSWRGGRCGHLAWLSLLFITTRFVGGLHAGGFVVDRDTFAFNATAGRVAGAVLNNTISEGVKAHWWADSNLVIDTDGSRTFIHGTDGMSAGAVLPLEFAPSQMKGTLVRFHATLNYGGMPEGGRAWVGFGLARNRSSIASNGTAWLQIKPDGSWKIYQYGQSLADGVYKGLRLGRHDLAIEIDTDQNTASFFVDEQAVTKDVQLPEPVMVPRRAVFGMFHFQGMDPRLAIEGMRVTALPKQPIGLAWVPNLETSDVFDLGSDARLTLDLHAPSLGDLILRTEWADFAGNVLETMESRLSMSKNPRTLSVALAAQKIPVNGIYSVRIVAEGRDAATGARHSTHLTQNFAVIPPRKVTADTYDRQSPYSVNYLPDWRLAARIGAKKIRQTYRTLEEFKRYLPQAKANGLLINGPLLDGPVIMRNALPGTIAQSTEKVSTIFRGVKAIAGDAVYAQEIHNEPENWAPTPRNNQFIPLVRMIAGVTDSIRKENLDLKVISTGTTHVNLSFLHQLATLGGQDAADIIAVHGYRSPLRPEFGHAEAVSAIRDLFGDKPIYIDEDAYFVWTPPSSGATPSITAPMGSSIEVDEVTQGIYLQRVYLNQLMAGFALVNQFSGVPNHDLSASRTHRRPGLVNYAALTHLLPHPKFVRRLTPETESLWVLEWETDGEPVTTLWTLNAPERVKLEIEGDDVVTFDTYANPLEKARSNSLEISVGGAPVFITGGRVKSIGSHSVLTEGDPLPRVLLPEELEARPLDIRIVGGAVSMSRSRVTAYLKNTSGKTIRGEVELAFLNKAPESWRLVPETSAKIDLPPAQTVAVSFIPESTNDGVAPFDPYNPVPGKGYLGLYWAEGYQVGVKVIRDEGSPDIIAQPNSRLCLRGAPWKTRDAVNLDAELSEWADVPVFRQLGDKKRNVELASFWTGTQDYMPTFRFAWCDDGLLFSAEVVDDRHDATQTGLNAWRTDSIQIGLDAHYQSTQRGHPDFLDYSVITLATSGVILQRDTPHRKAGPLKDVKLVTRRVEADYERPATTYYEALIPWEVLGLSLEKTKEGGDPLAIGFCALFNESDGWWRRGWEGYFSPMGGQIVDPRYFGDLTLVR